MLKRFALRVAVSCASMAFALMVAEVVLRHGYGVAPLEIDDVRAQFFRYDPLLGWFPRPGSEGLFEASQRTWVAHNEHGLRGPELGPKQRPRIVVLGDSFAWGYDVDREQRFTELLERRMPETEVVNLGVSGYGTDQSFLLLERHFDTLQPDFVLLVFTPRNDYEDNSSNVRHRYYYKPFFRVEAGELELSGIPVPRSAAFVSFPWPFGWVRQTALFHQAVTTRLRLLAEHVPDPTFAILADMDRFLRERNVEWAVGRVDEDATLADFLATAGIPGFSLAIRHQFRTHGRHWRPRGHQIASERIHRVLDQRGFPDTVLATR